MNKENLIKKEIQIVREKLDEVERHHRDARETIEASQQLEISCDIDPDEEEADYNNTKAELVAELERLLELLRKLGKGGQNG